VQRNALRAASRIKTVHKRAAENNKSHELEDIKLQLLSELQLRKNATITPAERKASLERTRVLKTRETTLREAGVQLARGRKRGRSSLPGPGPSTTSGSGSDHLYAPSLSGPSGTGGDHLYAPSGSGQLYAPSSSMPFGDTRPPSVFTASGVASTPPAPYDLGFELSPDLEPFDDWSALEEGGGLEYDTLTLEPKWNF
jgi:hypothetical protein